MFFAQLKNELWKMFGKKRTYIGFGAFVLTQALVLMLFKLLHGQDGLRRMLSLNGYDASDFISALTVALIILIPELALLMPLYVALVGGDLVAKESEDGTLRMILSRPISRFRLLLVKWIAGGIFASLLVIVLGITALLVSRILFPWKGMFVFIPGEAFSVLSAHDGICRYAGCHLLLAINSSVILTVAFMLSCFNMKPSAATIGTLSYIMLDFVLYNLEFFRDHHDWFLTQHFRCWLLVYLDPIPWSQIIQSELILLSVCATAFAVGFCVFQMRDIKS